MITKTEDEKNEQLDPETPNPGAPDAGTPDADASDAEASDADTLQPPEEVDKADSAHLPAGSNELRYHRFGNHAGGVATG
jgi:hypothetical protein